MLQQGDTIAGNFGADLQMKHSKTLGNLMQALLKSWLFLLAVYCFGASAH
jgi:hypothetical protein